MGRCALGGTGTGGDEITGNSSDDERPRSERDRFGSSAERENRSTVDPDRFRQLLTGASEGSDPRDLAPLAVDPDPSQVKHSVAVVDDHADLRELLVVRFGMVPGLNLVG